MQTTSKILGLCLAPWLVTACAPNMTHAVAGTRKAAGGIAAVSEVLTELVEEATVSAVMRCRAEGHATEDARRECSALLRILESTEEDDLVRLREIYDHLIRVIEEMEEIAPHVDALIEASREELRR